MPRKRRVLRRGKRRRNRPASSQRRATRQAIRRPRRPPCRTPGMRPVRPMRRAYPPHRLALQGSFRTWAVRRPKGAKVPRCQGAKVPRCQGGQAARARITVREVMTPPQKTTPRYPFRGADVTCAARVARTCLYGFFIMSKNSALFFVARILSRMNSIDSTSSISWMNLRSTHTFCSRSGRISSSSRRVPDLFRLIAG